MRIPAIDENISRIMSGGSATEIASRNRMHDGQPVFTKADVLKKKNDLDVQLRYMFDHFGIGRNYFCDKATEYYQKVEGHPKDKAKSDMQNLVRTVEKGGITFNRLEETIRTLGFEVVDRGITIRDDIGKLFSFTVSEALEDCKRAVEAQEAE